MEREERIKDLVEKIKAQRGNKAEEQKSKTVNVAMPKKSAVVRRCRLYIGWLHRSSADSRYKQIKTKVELFETSVTMMMNYQNVPENAVGK